MRNPFIPGRGDRVHTTITALRDNVNLKHVDGTVLLKKGDKREYDFDVRRSLRTHLQRKNLSNLVITRSIRVDVTRLSLEKKLVTDELESEESVEEVKDVNIVAGRPVVDHPMTMNPAYDSTSSDDSELEDEQEAPTPTSFDNEEIPIVVSPDESSASSESYDSCESMASDPFVDTSSSSENDLSEEEERIIGAYNALRAVKGVGDATARNLLELDDITEENVTSVPRCPKDEDKVKKIIIILRELNG